jgi:hypothetical protein
MEGLEDFSKLPPSSILPPDIEARATFGTFNEQLREFNRLHQYPEDWTMDLPPEHSQQAPVASPVSPLQSSGPSLRTETTALARHGHRRCSRTEGYVKEDNVNKKIEGCMKVATGYQMLVSRPENNGLLIYERVAASTFGRGFAATYNKRPHAKTVLSGAIEEQSRKAFEAR